MANIDKREALLTFKTNALEAKDDADKLKASLKDTSNEYKGLTEKTKELDNVIAELDEEINKLSDSTDRQADSSEGLGDSFAVLSDKAKNTIKSTQDLNKSLKSNVSANKEVAKTLRDSTLVTGLLDKATGGLYSTMKDTIGQVFELGKGLVEATNSQKVLTVSTNTTSVAMKVFRTALISTGIGALVVAIGYLIGKFQELSSAAEVNTEKLEENKRKVDALKSSYESLDEFLDYSTKIDIERAKRAGASEAELNALRTKHSSERVELISKEIEELRVLAGANETTAEQATELNKRITELYKRRADLRRNETLSQEQDRTAQYEKEKAAAEKRAQDAKTKTDEVKKARETELKAIETQLKSIESLSEKYKSSGYIEEGLTQAQSSSVYALKGDKAAIQKQVEDMSKEFQKLNATEQAAMLESFNAFKKSSEETTKEIDKQLTALYASFDKEKGDALTRAFDGYMTKQPLQYIISDLRSFEEEALTVSERIGLSNPLKFLSESEIDKIRENNVALIEEQKTKAMQELEILGATNEQKLAIEKQFQEQIVQENKNSADAIIRINELKGESQKAVVSESINLMGALADSAKEGTGLQKGLAIASTLMDTGQSAVATYKGYVQTFPAPYGQIAGVAGALASVAMGMKQVNNIKKIKTDGTETGGQSGGGVIVPTAQPNVSFVSSSDSQAGSNSLDIAEITNDKPVKAYVVAGDVTSAQEAERNQYEKTTL